eukprot:Skav206984  [mRNA]  locus=scaffold2010:33262:36241:+ [translate_table: standard]
MRRHQVSITDCSQGSDGKVNAVCGMPAFEVSIHRDGREDVDQHHGGQAKTASDFEPVPPPAIIGQNDAVIAFEDHAKACSAKCT